MLVAGQAVQQARELGRVGQALGVREVRAHDQAVHVGQVADDARDIVFRVGDDPDVPPEDGARPRCYDFCYGNSASLGLRNV